MVENLPTNAGDTGLIPGLGRPPMPQSSTIQRRLVWPLSKDDMEIHEVFHIFRDMDGPRDCHTK